MGLFPSNIGENKFPNLAGRVESKEQATKELNEAGIHVHNAVTPGEVNCEVIGACGSWIFRRAWYYWVAEGPGIPSAAAKILHDKHGKEVRVEGHCGCPDPIEYCKGHPVTYYHIDTQRGLNALVETINEDLLLRLSERSECSAN